MLGTRLASLSSLASKSSIVSSILVGNALVWYFTVLLILQSASTVTLSVWVVHFSALILSALAGASFAKQMERSKFLILWTILGIVAPMMLFALNSTSEILVCLVSAFLGLSMGFGMPTCMSYFTDSVAIEKRGRVSGMTMLASGIGMAAFGFVNNVAPGNLLLAGLILGIWRLSSLAVFLSAKDYRRIVQKDDVSSYKKVLTQKSFMLYFVPWVMFSFVNYLAVPNGLPKPIEGYPAFDTVQTVFMGGAAALGGFFIDTIGRKRIAIAGFAMLGVGTAVLGFSGRELLNTPPSVLYFNSALDGIAMGFLLVLFVLTLWGDLSHSSSSDKFYALGVMPFFVSRLLEQTVGPIIHTLVETDSPTALFSFTAFFLFLAVLPLAYAPETLPEKAMKQRELKIYVEKAQEIAQKYY